MSAVQDAKARVSFIELVSETHTIGRDGKILCPVHTEGTPSCHVYDDGAFCHGCGWRADHVAWLEVTQDMSTAAAIREVKARAGLTGTPSRPRSSRQAEWPASKTEGVIYTPWNTEQVTALLDSAHIDAEAWRMTADDHLPGPLRNRGFTQTDLGILRVTTAGRSAGLPIFTPAAQVAALKLRNAHAKPRYQYYRGERNGKDAAGETVYKPWPPGSEHLIPPAHNPAWCNPGFTADPERLLLIMEGELNAAITWLALKDQADVMGTAGTSGRLYLEAIAGRDVLIYADDDKPGREALARWTRDAQAAGAARVRMLKPLPAGLDACDLAGKHGKQAIHNWLGRLLEGRPA